MNAPANWPCLRIDTRGSGKQSHTRVILDCSISPNAPKTEVVGWHDGALRLRLAAPPVDGAANDALRKWLAQQLGVPQSQVELLRGAASRRKQWAIDVAEATVHHWLASLPALRN
ncbi:MAG: DUF167 domain-containing protein [Burkholderiales bacterium]|nr:DUF167 domain-containing protein [Burkholderiales bacterium]MBH2017458.1 DUF167 domain-containing protein [Burkholderiales bacterium]